MGTTPLKFTGVSQFSDDFQTILTRSAAIANLPIQSLQNDQATLLAKKQQLTDLNLSIQDFATTLNSLAAMGSSRAIGAVSSNTSLVSVQSSSTTQPGIYTISDIESLATAASETSASGYATADTTPVSADGTLQLVFGSTTKTIKLDASHNNLNGLRDSINALGLGLNATVLNTGNLDNPFYLSVSSVSTGVTTLQLRETEDDPDSNLLTGANQGTNVRFKLNGLQVEKSTNQVKDVIPGVSFIINGTTSGDDTVSLSLTSSSAQLYNALQDLATNYNALSEKVDTQVGENAGVLSGDFIIRELQNDLRGITNYSGAGTISRLADLGIEMDDSGKMSFNTDVFYSLTADDLQAAFDFLGSSTTGFGALSANFNQFTDPYNGIVVNEQAVYDQADSRIDSQISAITDRVNLMQATLSTELQVADTMLAQLESQQNLLDASIQSLNYAIYGKQTTP